MTLQITLLSIKEMETLKQGILRYITELYQNLVNMHETKVLK